MRPAAIAEPERFAPRQDVQQRLRFLGQGPGSETGAAERQLGRLDADQAHMGAAVEDEGVAVDDLAHAAALDDFGVATRLGRDTARERDQDGEYDRAANHGFHPSAFREWSATTPFTWVYSPSPPLPSWPNRLPGRIEITPVSIVGIHGGYPFGLGDPVDPGARDGGGMGR